MTSTTTARKCDYPRCGQDATTSYQDKARHVWKLCERHRRDAARRRI